MDFEENNNYVMMRKVSLITVGWETPDEQGHENLWGFSTGIFFPKLWWWLHGYKYTCIKMYKLYI